MSSLGHPRSLIGRCNRPGLPDAVAGPRRGRTMPSIFFHAPTQWVHAPRLFSQGCLISPSQHLARMDFASHGVQQPAESRRWLQASRAIPREQLQAVQQPAESRRWLQSRASEPAIEARAVQQPAESRRWLQAGRASRPSASVRCNSLRNLEGGCRDCPVPARPRHGGATACGISKVVAAVAPALLGSPL